MRMSIFSASHCISLRHFNHFHLSNFACYVAEFYDAFCQWGSNTLPDVHSHHARTGKYIININGTTLYYKKNIALVLDQETRPNSITSKKNRFIHKIKYCNYKFSYNPSLQVQIIYSNESHKIFTARCLAGPWASLCNSFKCTKEVSLSQS